MDQKKMSEQSTADVNESLPAGFRLFVVVAIILFGLIGSLLVFIVVKKTLLQQDLASFDVSLNGYAQIVLQGENASFQRLTKQVLSQARTVKVAVFRPNGDPVWPLTDPWELSRVEQNAVADLTKMSTPYYWVRDGLSQFIAEPNVSNLFALIKVNEAKYVTLTGIRIANRAPSLVIKSLRDYSQIYRHALFSALIVFVVILLSCFLIFRICSRLMRRNIQHIKEDEDHLSDQVSQLSSLLAENKQLQRNMKTASSRAVELNERFLRRVGSDLHDGPAQSIGYAMLRLNQVSSKQISEELGYEFHAVKEALNESLDEIRGISSGLVLPELEKMSLEDSIHKIIERHKMNTGADVKESYLDLPEDIPLPIKICAYRFAQEGLNNAYKHGNAKKCRFTAQVINDVLHLSLKDNGMGFRKSVLNTDGGHLGLAGLKDRIESLGGKLNINSELGVGTAIKASVQLSVDQ